MEAYLLEETEPDVLFLHVCVSMRSDCGVFILSSIC
jgi:hypothetical protein